MGQNVVEPGMRTLEVYRERSPLRPGPQPAFCWILSLEALLELLLTTPTFDSSCPQSQSDDTLNKTLAGPFVGALGVQKETVEKQ